VCTYWFLPLIVFSQVTVIVSSDGSYEDLNPYDLIENEADDAYEPGGDD